MGRKISWFKKKKNNNNEEIQRLFETFLVYSSEAAKTICKLASVSGEDSTEDFPDLISITNRVSIEFLLFYIHILDRVSFPVLPKKDRLQMVATFIDRTVRTLPTIFNVNKKKQPGNKHGKWYFMQFLVRQDEYWQFEKFMTEDISELTAFQRFGESISQLLGEESHDAVSIPCQAYIVETLKHIDLQKFIASMHSNS